MLSIAYLEEEKKKRFTWLKKEPAASAFDQNTLIVRPTTIDIHPIKPICPQLGFNLSNDGIEILPLDEEHWFILGDFENHASEALFYSKWVKALECLPKKDSVICLLKAPFSKEELLHYQEACKKNPHVKVFIQSNPKASLSSHLFWHTAALEVQKLDFRLIEIESTKGYFVIKCYPILNKSQAAKVFQFPHL